MDTPAILALRKSVSKSQEWVDGEGVKPRIMYIEAKTGHRAGEAWIGLVTFSKTGKRVYYRGQAFQRPRHPGGIGNHLDLETGDEYWISGPKKAGGDRHYAETQGPVRVDEDVSVEYWTAIRGKPERQGETDANR